jgi:GDP-L-fucose synthase
MAASRKRKIVAFQGSIVYDSAKPDGMPRKRLDTSSIKRLGWQAETGLPEGIEKTYTWYAMNTTCSSQIGWHSLHAGATAE